MFDVLFLNRYVAYRFFFSCNKYIDIELPSLICTEFPFSLLALHYPPIQLLTRIHKHARARARVPLLFCLFFSFLFSLSTLQLAASLARLSFYSFRTRALAFTRTHAWSRTHATERFAHTTRVPFVRFFLFFLFLHNHHRVKPHLPRPAVAQQPPVANKMLYGQ